MATTKLTQGIEEYETDITFGNGIDVTGTGTFSDSITGTTTSLCRRLLRTRQSHSIATRQDQRKNT